MSAYTVDPGGPGHGGLGKPRTMAFAMAGALTSAGSWWLEERSGDLAVIVDALTDLLVFGLPIPTSDGNLQR